MSPITRELPAQARGRFFWNFISTNTINRTLHSRSKIRILSYRAESISHELAKRTSERYFQHSKIKFVSPRGHVISFFFAHTTELWDCQETWLPRSRNPDTLRHQVHYGKRNIKIFNLNRKTLWRFDCQTNSPCQHLEKCIENSLENMYTGIMVWGINWPF